MILSLILDSKYVNSVTRAFHSGMKQIEHKLYHIKGYYREYQVLAQTRLSFCYLQILETKYVGDKLTKQRLETKYVGDKNEMLIPNCFGSKFCPYNILDKAPFGPFCKYIFGKLRIYNLF